MKTGELPVSNSTPLVTLTTFTDPMMGLSYEMEPVYRKLETHFGSSIEFRYRMGLLVPDVMNLVNPCDIRLGKDAAIKRYNARLAQTYLDEEGLGGLPIVMDGFQLFSSENRSTLPLDLAYEAVLAMTPERADEFLYALRFATIAETRPTTRKEEILRVASKVGLDVRELSDRMEGDEALQALTADLALAQRLGIHALPTILVTYGDKNYLANGLLGYDDLCAALSKITKGKLLPHLVEQTTGALGELLWRHPLISAPEIREALDLPSNEAAHRLAGVLVSAGEAQFVPVKHSWFLRVK